MSDKPHCRMTGVKGRRKESHKCSNIFSKMAQNIPKLVKWEHVIFIGDAASSCRYENKVNQMSVSSVTNQLYGCEQVTEAPWNLFPVSKKCVCVCACVRVRTFVCTYVCTGVKWLGQKQVTVLRLFPSSLLEDFPSNKKKRKKKEKKKKVRNS